MSRTPHTDSEYRIEVEDQVWAALSSLPEALQTKVTTFWRDSLRHVPYTAPATKRLRGAWKEYFQYDVDRFRRMLYRVDERRRIVFVDFLGSHPSWDKRHS
jgi:mRNA-degrading endonuclease RelE of RelBE toxin-antitoxin system